VSRDSTQSPSRSPKRRVAPGALPCRVIEADKIDVPNVGAREFPRALAWPECRMSNPMTWVPATFPGFRIARQRSGRHTGLQNAALSAG